MGQNKNQTTFEAIVLHKTDGTKRYYSLADLSKKSCPNLFEDVFKIETGLAKYTNKERRHFTMVKEIAKYYLGVEVDAEEAQKHEIIKKKKPECKFCDFKFVLIKTGVVYEIEEWEEILTPERISNLKLYQLFDEKYYLGIN